MEDPIAIPLGNGGCVLIDSDDEEFVTAFHWGRARGGNTFYAVRQYVDISGKQHCVPMHRELVGLSEGDPRFVDHKNGDGLDNRRSNLRVCTPRQNSANQRKRASRSRFKGTAPYGKRWIAKISVYLPDIRTHIGLGAYDTEACAAFAFNCAAGLLRDPEFYRFNAIPEAELPSDAVRREIKSRVVTRIKEVLEGRHYSQRRHSIYPGITRKEDGWLASIKFDGARILSARYKTEAEAAYAYRCARLGIGKKYTWFPESHWEIIAPEKREVIDLHVRLKLNGKKPTINRTGYRCVKANKDQTAWSYEFMAARKRYRSRSYPTPREAAEAYNDHIIAMGLPAERLIEIEG